MMFNCKWFSCRLFLILFILSFCHASFADINLSASDQELLETVQRQSFEFFMKERDSKTGLVRDKAHNFKSNVVSAPASIAATGFALTAYGVGVQRNWIDYGMAKQMTLQTLEFLLNHADQKNGFFYHFLKMETGERTNKSEVSPIDTALLLAGVLFAAEFYEDSQIRDLAMKIYERVDWPWMQNKGETFALAWTPEGGFDKRRWDHYDESMILYLLAMGSPSHPISADVWKKISRPIGSYKNFRMIQMPPLFTHQFSHIWIDFRDKNDGFADYFQNSVNATLANRAFAMDEALRVKGYGENFWGLSASNGPFGYKAYGAPPGWAFHDGTVSPSGCGSSIVFTPNESIACLRNFYENFKDKLWGEYGFSDALNLDKNWFDQFVIGIDQGALILMIENYRSELIWNSMKKNIYLNKAMDVAGFVAGTKEIPWPQAPEHSAVYIHGGIQADGYLKDWPKTEALILNAAHQESGSLENEFDLSAEFRFGWNEYALFFSAKVTDESFVAKRSGKNIWKDDLVELFVDPGSDGLYWNDSKDFQIGFSPSPGKNALRIWSWFQNDNSEEVLTQVAGSGFVYEKGYLVEGAVKWSYLGIRPEAGQQIKISPAVHDSDKNQTEGKLQWFFRNEEALNRFALGNIRLEKANA